MKPTLNEEIKMSAKGVDYVDSLVPTDKDCINAIKYQIDDEYIRAGEKGIYAKDEKGKFFLLRKEMFTNDPHLKPKKQKYNILPLIIFTFMVISIVLWIIAIIKISEL